MILLYSSCHYAVLKLPYFSDVAERQLQPATPAVGGILGLEASKEAICIWRY